MRVYIAMLLLIFSGLVFSDPNDIIPEIKELTKVQREKYGKLSGGSSVILNSKSYERQEFEMYFIVYDFATQSIKDKTVTKTRKDYEQMFEKDFLHNDYINKPIELENGEKFLYGKFSRIILNNIYRLELYFINKNNELKTKIFYKSSKDTKGYGYIDKINQEKREGYYYTTYFPGELIIITPNQKMQLRYPTYDKNIDEFYDYLLDLFKDEIPPKILQLKKEQLENDYRYMMEPDYIEK